MIDQLTVFLENKPGRLVELCELLGDEGVTMHALMVADTTEFGVIRIICDKPKHALAVLREKGYSAALTKVLAVEVPDVPGGLAQILSVLHVNNINIEYAYCFVSPCSGSATDVLKVETGKLDEAIERFNQAGVTLLHAQDLYANDVEEV